MSENFTQEDTDLAGLSEEELKAIEDEDEDESASLEEIADEDEDELSEQDDDAGTKAAASKEKEGEEGEEDAEVATKGDAKASDEAKAAEETAAPEEKANDDETDDGGFVPVRAVKHVENFAQEMGAISTELSALDTKEAEIDKKVEDGDMTIAESRAELRKINSERLKLTEKKITIQSQEDRAVYEEEQNEASAAALWQREQDIFFDDHPEYFVASKDKNGKDVSVPDDVLMGALDAAVKRVARDPSNEGRSGTWVMRQAHKAVMAKFAIKEQESKQEVKTEVKQEKKPARKPDLKSVPKTLSNVPSAKEDPEGGGEDEFGYLDKLSGIEYEQAIAKIEADPAKYSRFMAA